jgi:hypothetical protein
MGYSKAELTCAGCMGPCGFCRDTYTEQEYQQMQLMKMDDLELEKEMQFNTFQLGARIGQIVTIQPGSILKIWMLKSDIVNLLDRLEAIRGELERRVIP